MWPVPNTVSCFGQNTHKSSQQSNKMTSFKFIEFSSRGTVTEVGKIVIEFTENYLKEFDDSPEKIVEWKIVKNSVAVRDKKQIK